MFPKTCVYFISHLMFSREAKCFWPSLLFFQRKIFLSYFLFIGFARYLKLEAFI